MRTLVLGLGNPIMGDDGVGLRVIQTVRKQLGDVDGIEVQECYSAGVTLLDRIVDYDNLIVVDAIRSGHEPGTVFQPRIEDLPIQPPTMDFHGLGLTGVLELGKRLGFKMPEKISLVVIAVIGDFEACEVLSPPVEKAVPVAAEKVLAELKVLHKVH